MQFTRFVIIIIWIISRFFDSIFVPLNKWNPNDPRVSLAGELLSRLWKLFRIYTDFLLHSLPVPFHLKNFSLFRCPWFHNRRIVTSGVFSELMIHFIQFNEIVICVLFGLCYGGIRLLHIVCNHRWMTTSFWEWYTTFTLCCAYIRAISH